MVQKNSNRWTHKREEMVYWTGGGVGAERVGGSTGDTVLRQKFKGLRFLAGS